MLAPWAALDKSATSMSFLPSNASATTFMIPMNGDHTSTPLATMSAQRRRNRNSQQNSLLALQLQPLGGLFVSVGPSFAYLVKLSLAKLALKSVGLPCQLISYASTQCNVLVSPSDCYRPIWCRAACPALPKLRASANSSPAMFILVVAPST